MPAVVYVAAVVCANGSRHIRDALQPLLEIFVLASWWVDRPERDMVFGRADRPARCRSEGDDPRAMIHIGLGLDSPQSWLMTQAELLLMEFGATSWVAVGLAAVAFFALGGLWYGPFFGRAWMPAAGVAEGQAEGSKLPVILGVAFLFEVLAALGLAAVIGADATVLDGLITGAAVGVLIAGTILGVQYLFEGRPALLWVLNGIHALLGFSLMGAIIGALQ